MRRMSRPEFNKKAQISDTMVWVVATIVIVFLITASVFLTTLLGKTKVLDKTEVYSTIGDSSAWVSEKTDLALNRNDANKEKINLWISAGGNDENTQ